MCIVVAVEYADYFSRVVMSCSFLFFLCSAAYRFLFDGNRVNDTDTPESLEMVRCVLPAWVFCFDVRAFPLHHTEASFSFVRWHSCSSVEAVLLASRRHDPGAFHCLCVPGFFLLTRSTLLWCSCLLLLLVLDLMLNSDLPLDRRTWT